jgi:hypothetical protein
VSLIIDFTLLVWLALHFTQIDLNPDHNPLLFFLYSTAINNNEVLRYFILPLWVFLLLIDILVMIVTWKIALIRGKYMLRPLIATKILHSMLTIVFGFLFALFDTNNALKIFTIFFTLILLSVMTLLDYRIIKISKRLLSFELNSSKI